jgi:uncharacterized protein
MRTEDAMPRPRCCRRIDGTPGARIFKPAGRPATSLQEVALSMEEYEAIRLADFEGLYHEEAAGRMGVSRQTFGRTIEAARRTVARALVEGLALRIADPEAAPGRREFRCACGHAWQEPFGAGRPPVCPACGGGDFRRAGCHNTKTL